MRNAMGWAAAAMIAAVMMTVAPSSVRADAVLPPPEDCPRGTSGRSGHGGPYCGANRACDTAADCSTGETCEPIPLCIGSQICGGRPVPDSGPCSVETANQTCGSESCAEGSCETRSVCVGSDDPPLPGDCGCRAITPSRSPIAAVLAGLAALGLLVFRRR